MNETEILFHVYKQYLVQIASKEGRPFRLPTSITSLEKRTDAPFFYVLKDKLIKHGIKKYSDITRFFELAVKQLHTFHITDIIDNFNDLYEVYNKTKNDNTLEAKKNKIKKAFAFLTEYAIIKDINTYEDLLKGSPPILLKLWKQGKLDDRMIVTLIDFDKIKKKVWYRIYCGEIASKINRLKDEIGANVELVSTIENELLKLKQTLNK
jgi:hypothetical protein